MPTVVVRYQPSPEHADTNQGLVEAVFAELAAAAPPGLTYTTLRLGDGTFIHIADVAEGPNPLEALPSFAAFLDGIGERCAPGQGPNPQPATVVGSYATAS